MATPAISLLRWLGFYAVDTQEECVITVLRLLKRACVNFPAALNDLQGWEAVVRTLEWFYEMPLTLEIQKLEDASAETLQNVLELVLAAVVQGEAKETFVKDILSMEDALQADLMTIIERVMSQGTDKERGEKDEEGKEANEALGGSCPLYLTRDAALERQKRKNGFLKEENIHLARELTQVTKKFRDVEVEKEQMVAIVQQLKEQLDVGALRRERSLHAEYDGRIQTLQLQVDVLKTELDDKTVLVNQLPALRDEVDLLRPVANKLVKMESAVVKYKAKIDELAGAKDSLRRLEGTNADLIERNLLLESKLAKAASWQHKLKEAKDTNTVLDFRVSELEIQLVHERQELVMARAELGSIQSALQEATALNAQLQESTGHVLSVVDVTENSSVSSASNVASGISEFNPELKQKLIRLEFENVALKNQVDNERGARIDGLLDKIDDLTRLKKYFEKKYFDSQHVLQSTKSEFKLNKTELYLTIARLQANAGQLCEWQLCLQEDVAVQVSEKQIAVDERDRLAAELGDSMKRQHHLTRALSSKDHELSETRKANEMLACQNERLEAQRDSLSLRKKALETNLARQNECVAMQAEDAQAEQLRLQRQKTCELKNNEQLSDIISSMTLLVGAKSAEIMQLTSKVQQDKLEHDTDRQKLAAAHASTAMELKQYQQLYSVSNANWNAKEEELKSRIKELERLCSQYTPQEQALKSTIKAQLQSNARLVAKNKAMKVDAVKLREMVAMLEHTTTRLESKVTLLERERSHLSTQTDRKRDTEDGISSYSSQLSTQVTLVVAELEKVVKENKKLHLKQSGCRCCHESLPQHGTPDFDQKAKTYYVNRIQQLEHGQQQVEHKRRELLLVNAKLVQEQKQLRVKNASLSNEVRELKESVNHWRLCDERRRKKEPPSLPPANIPCAKKSTRGLLNDTVEQRAKQEQAQKTLQTSTELLSESQKSLHDSSVAGSSLSWTRKVGVLPGHENGTYFASVGKRKRKQEEDCTVRETTSIGAVSIANCTVTDAEPFLTKPPAPTSASNSQRRVSQLFRRSLVPDKTNQVTEKPSECKQQ